jgi:hypothetical protein
VLLHDVMFSLLLAVADVLAHLLQSLQRCARCTLLMCQLRNQQLPTLSRGSASVTVGLQNIARKQFKTSSAVQIQYLLKPAAEQDSCLGKALACGMHTRSDTEKQLQVMTA